MSNILSIKRGIYRNQFKCIYPKTQKLFAKILLHFYNLHKISNVLKKPWASYHSLSIFEIIHSEKYGYMNA